MIHVNINDKRWDKHKIDFAYIVNTVLSFALKFDRHEQILRKANDTGAGMLKGVFTAGVNPVFANHHLTYGTFSKPLALINREVSIILTNDKEMRALNKKWRGQNKPTNVLSFETGDAELLGDIFISYDRVLAESKEQGKSFDDHTTHLVVHGVLHLLGYDHENDSDADKMESLETKILKKLGIGNPYLNNNKDYPAPSVGVETNRFSHLLTYSLIPFLLGFAAQLGFAPFYFWPLTLLCLFAVYLIVFGKNKFNLWSAFSFGGGYALGNFWWMVSAIYAAPDLAAQYWIWTVPALIGMAAVGALIFSLPFILTNLVHSNSSKADLSRRSVSEGGWRRAVTFAAACSSTLWMREWILSGFPWNPIGNIFFHPLDAGWLVNSMSLWGAIGLTFVITGIIAMLAELVRKEEWQGLGVFTPLLIIGIVSGYINTRKFDGEYPSAIARIVQPGKSAQEKATHTREAAIANAENTIANLESLSMSDAGFVIWPETSYPYTVVTNASEYNAFSGARARPYTITSPQKIGAKVITGTMSYQSGKFFNSLAIFDENGELQDIYSKTHLVPFGEYAPIWGFLPSPGNLSSGDGPVIMSMGNLKFAPAICYEIIFSDSLLPRGQRPDFILNLTNDVWFGQTPGIYQHLDMVRRQAIEMGLPILRVNYAGISAYIDRNGNMNADQMLYPKGKIGKDITVVANGRKTVYSMIGLHGTMAIILIFVFLLIRKRESHLKD